MRRVKDVVTREGNPVGSWLYVSCVELDPVTTDRPMYGREIAVPAAIAVNLRL